MSENQDSKRALVAARLREARKMAKLSQGQVAKLPGMHRPTVSEIEAANRDDPRHVFGQLLEDCRAPFRIAMGRDAPARLMEPPQHRRFWLGQRLAVDLDRIAWPHIKRWRLDRRAVDADAALQNPAFRIAPGTQAGPRHRLGDPHFFRNGWLPDHLHRPSLAHRRPETGSLGVWCSRSTGLTGAFFAHVMSELL